MLNTMTPDQIRASERALTRGTWVITAGAVLFSVLTVTPLVRSVTPPGWSWTAPVLPIVVDTAVVVVVRLDATVGRLGERVGAWPAILRWLTGLATLALNVGLSALAHDGVGVGVHLVAPLLLIAVSEAGRSYRAAITRALERIGREQQEDADRRRRERTAEVEAERERRAQEVDAAAAREREAREHAALLEQQAADAQAARDQAARDHEARMEAARAEREAAARRDEQQAALDRLRLQTQQQAAAAAAAREQADRERAAADQAREHRDEQPALTAPEKALTRPLEAAPAPALDHPTPPDPEPVNTPADDTDDTVNGSSKLAEHDALTAIRRGVEARASVREMARETGWSVGWVTARAQEARAELAAADDGQLALAG